MERYAIMKSITKPIPSTYFLNITQSYIYFSYPNQHITCTKCGDTEHHGGKCPVFTITAPWKRNNVINLPSSEFPDLPKSHAWLKQNIKMPSSSLVNTPNTEEVSSFDYQDFSNLQLTLQVTLHTDTTDTATTDTATSCSTTVYGHRYPSYYLKNPTDVPKLTPTTQNEDDLNPILPLNEVENLPVAQDTISGTTLVKNHVNALSLENSKQNAEYVTTDDKPILEENLPNAHALDKSLPNAVTVTTINGATLEKNHNNAETVTKYIDPTLEKKLFNAKTKEINQKYDPNINSVTDKINNLSLDSDPAHAVSEQKLTISSYSPPNLRATTARSSHTYV